MLRSARGSEQFAWVTPHVFRKTAATILDDAKLTARVIADQLGHSKPSMTQDVYIGRTAAPRRCGGAGSCLV
jgi:integrase